MIFLIPLPPPLHGSSVVGQSIANSKIIKERLSPCVVNISAGGQNSDLFSRVYSTLKAVIITWNKAFRSSEKVYISVAVNGLGLLKDFLIILPYIFLRKKVIYHFHNRGIKTNGENSLLYRLIYKIMFHGNYAIVLDDLLVKECSAYFKPNNIFVCNNGISASIRKNKLDKRDPLRIIFLGNLIKEKGILLAIEVWQELYAESGIEMHVVGKEYDVTYEEIESQLSTSERASIHLHGPKYNDEKFDILASCDIIVFPSSYKMELFPLVLLEAMSQGVIPVAFNVGAISRIYSDKEGWHVWRNDKDEFKRQLRKAIRDTNLVDRKRACIDLYNERYTLEKFEKRLSDIIEGI